MRVRASWSRRCSTGCRVNAGLEPKRAPSNHCARRNWVELAHDGAGRRASFSANGDGDAAALLPALFFFDVTYFGGSSETYQIPLAIGIGADLDRRDGRASGEHHCENDDRSRSGRALRCERVREDFHQELLRLIAGNATLPLFDAGKSATEPAAAMPISPPARRIACRFSPRQTPKFRLLLPFPLRSARSPERQPHLRERMRPSRQSASGLRLQPRESPSAGDVLPAGRPVGCARVGRLSCRMGYAKTTLAVEFGRAVKYLDPISTKSFF